MNARFLLCSACFLAARIAFPQSSPYFPVSGNGALHQCTLDLTNPTVVLSLAAEPGQEDLRTLAALRLQTGAHIISAYATNGGSTPSDLDGDLPNDVAGRRKEEASAAMRWCGGDAYFLNLPDQGISGTRAALAGSWRRDTVISRCVRMIRTLRPDAVLLARDARANEGDSTRGELLRELFLESAAAAKDTVRFPLPGLPPWAVKRILLEEGPGSARAGIPDDVPHPVWRKTARDIAGEAGRLYASLRIRHPLQEAKRSRAYALLVSSLGDRGVRGLNGFLTLTASLQAIRPGIMSAAAEARKKQRDPALRAIVLAGAAIEETVAKRGKTLSPLERRVLARWKSGLEDLRCLLLGIDIPFTVSDTLLAPVQLTFLRFGKNVRTPASKDAEVLFPSAMTGTWVVNESDKFRFPMTYPSEFRIVTPEQMELNAPPALAGLAATEMRLKFPLIVFHRDSVMTQEFAFQREIALRIAPPQSVEVLTPVVRVIPGERLLVALQNVSRETYRGTMWVGDSVARESRKQITLANKGAMVRDTLALAWTDTLRDGDYLIGLHIGKGKPVAHFLARKFPVAADTSMRVGVVTGLLSSPLEDALRRLRVPCVALDAGAPGSGALDGLRTVLLDRNALGLVAAPQALASRLLRWVEAGGHLVMLSQAWDPPEARELTRLIGFTGEPALPPDAPAIADSSSRICASPNRLGEEDWRDWTIARSRGIVRVPAGADLTVHVRNGRTGAPLVASVTLGRGTITAVALDLVPQLQTVHAGALRLFANLLAY
jgi:hypothetical protein